MTARLVRLELRRSVLPWMLPLIAGVFWFVVYRRGVQSPPLWNVRAMGLQTAAVSVFVPVVVGAAAWTGSREGRHGLTDLVGCTARPRWMRQLAAWAATTGWALLAYLGCVGVLYAVTARQAAWGGPLWWPVAVGAAGVPAFAAIGFAAGALRPSRFTTPLAAVAVFLALELGVQLIQGGRSHWQISPLVAGPWELGSVDGVATFYRYLPDLPVAQLLFLGGLTAAVLGVLGLPAGAGGRWLRRSAAAVTVAGLLVAGTAVALAGTGRLDAHGMIAIPALHDAADDRPVPYTPVCGGGRIPVCLHPAYTVYLPAVSAALEPVLGELAGLPGAPARISQAAPVYRQLPGNGVELRGPAGPCLTGTPPQFHLVLPGLPAGQDTGALAAAVRTDAGRDIVACVVGGGRVTGPAQEAVTAALLGGSDPPADAGTAAAARRFAALPPEARHAWLVANVAALRAGRVDLGQLP